MFYLEKTPPPNSTYMSSSLERQAEKGEKIGEGEQAKAKKGSCGQTGTTVPHGEAAGRQRRRKGERSCMVANAPLSPK